MFQNPFNQISGAKLTVEEEIAFGLENLGIAREEMRERVGRALDIFRSYRRGKTVAVRIVGGTAAAIGIGFDICNGTAYPRSGRTEFAARPGWDA